MLFIIVKYNKLLMMTGCEIETFGRGCSNRCSGHCLNNVSCNSTNGHCDIGCPSGYQEPFCIKGIDVYAYLKFMLLKV